MSPATEFFVLAFSFIPLSIVLAVEVVLYVSETFDV